MSSVSVHIPNKVHNTTVALQNKYRHGKVTGPELETFIEQIYNECPSFGVVDLDMFIVDFHVEFAKLLKFQNAWNAVQILVGRAFGLKEPVIRRRPIMPEKFTKKAPVVVKAKAKAKGAAA